MTAIPQHSSATNEHPTPAIVVEPARRLLGGFDLDPASCAEFNETIKAEAYYDIERDGLKQTWFGSVFHNPPGGLLRMTDGEWKPVPKNENGRYMGPGTSSMWVWWDKLTREYETGRVTSAFFVGFTLEILRTSQEGAFPAQLYPRCYPKKRLAFQGDQPTHANVLVYLPPKGVDAYVSLERLRAEFGELGFCERGAAR